MQVETLIVPYDSAQRNVRMGAGPLRLFEAVVEPMLHEAAPPASSQIIEPAEAFRAEIATAFDLNRRLAQAVRAAVQARKFPLVLSGNCNSALGTTAGVRDESLGVIWFDAHGDFNTPETSTSGFFDGMGLAALAGLCWRNLTASVPGFGAVPGARILHIGGRDVSECEARNMAECGAQMIAATDVQSSVGREHLNAALDRLRDQTTNVYVHLDLDVIDRAELCANEFAPPGGLPVATIVDVLRQITAKFNVSAIAMASYDPAQDDESRGKEAVRRLLDPVLSPLIRR